MQVDFICGCRHDVKTEDIGWWREISTDQQGFIVCVAHHTRRKNWNTIPEGHGKVGLDYDYAKYTALQIERHLIFGAELPKQRELKIDSNRIQDKRDNRDPEMVGLARLAGSNGH